MFVNWQNSELRAPDHANGIQIPMTSNQRLDVGTDRSLLDMTEGYLHATQVAMAPSPPEL